MPRFQACHWRVTTNLHNLDATSTMLGAQPIFTYSSLNTILTSSELVLSGSTLGHTGQNTKQNQMILFKKKFRKPYLLPPYLSRRENQMLFYNSAVDLEFSFSLETYRFAVLKNHRSKAVEGLGTFY